MTATKWSSSRGHNVIAVNAPAQHLMNTNKTPVHRKPFFPPHCHGNGSLLNGREKTEAESKQKKAHPLSLGVNRYQWVFWAVLFGISEALDFLLPLQHQFHVKFNGTRY